MTQLHRIAYCSHNLIPGDALSRELHAILAISRRNNAQLAVTGALLYSSGSFAQVLEGPLTAIEHIFESIQCDPRHGEVMVIENGPIAARTFPEWSMAFAGSGGLDELPQAAAAFDEAFAGVTGGGKDLLRLLRDLVIDEGEWAEDVERRSDAPRAESQTL